MFTTTDSGDTISTTDSKASGYVNPIALDKSGLDAIRSLNKRTQSESADSLPNLQLDGGTQTDGGPERKIVPVSYPDGTSRTFVTDHDGNLVRFVDTDGKLFSKNSDGQWLDEKGKLTEWKGLVLTKDNTLIRQNKDGSIEEWRSDGRHERKDKSEIGDNMALYPDPENRAREAERIADLLKKNPLNDEGKTVVSDAHKLGVDDVDLFHGRMVVSGGDTKFGDGGELYRKWSGLDGVEKRTSSHFSDVDAQQYQVRLGPGNSVVLFGLTPEGNTWFQFEKDAGRRSDFYLDSRSLVREQANITANILHGDSTNLFTRDAHDRDADLSAWLDHQGVGPFGFNDKGELVVGKDKTAGGGANV